MKLKVALASAVVALGLATPSFAAPFAPTPVAYPGHRAQQWELIGSATVNNRAQRDVIRGYGDDRYSQIKVCVYRNPVRIFDLDVRFKNGGHQDVAVRNVIGAGQCTRVIDLKGNRRDIQSVSIVYKKAGFGPFAGPFTGPFGNAQVRVFAR